LFHFDVFFNLSLADISIAKLSGNPFPLSSKQEQSNPHVIISGTWEDGDDEHGLSYFQRVEQKHETPPNIENHPNN